MSQSGIRRNLPSSYKDKAVALRTENDVLVEAVTRERNVAQVAQRTLNRLSELGDVAGAVAEEIASLNGLDGYLLPVPTEESSLIQKASRIEAQIKSLVMVCLKAGYTLQVRDDALTRISESMNASLYSSDLEAYNESAPVSTQDLTDEIERLWTKAETMAGSVGTAGNSTQVTPNTSSSLNTPEPMPEPINSGSGDAGKSTGPFGLTEGDLQLVTSSLPRGNPARNTNKQLHPKMK